MSPTDAEVLFGEKERAPWRPTAMGMVVGVRFVVGAWVQRIGERSVNMNVSVSVNRRNEGYIVVR
jgi:uncharacterized membrane-anchored protein YhcB (DUF1043 family)